jgi:hypothetical protein
MAAGLLRLSVATDDRILRKIVFGFLVVTVPPAGRVQWHPKSVCAGSAEEYPRIATTDRLNSIHPVSDANCHCP